jgi:hypothetical protein
MTNPNPNPNVSLTNCNYIQLTNGHRLTTKWSWVYKLTEDNHDYKLVDLRISKLIDFDDSSYHFN